PVDEATGPDHAPNLRRPHLIVVNGAVQGGRLTLSWQYSRDLHRRETIAALAERYRQALDRIIDHCLSPDAGGFTPSDFPEARVQPDQLRPAPSTLNTRRD